MAAASQGRVYLLDCDRADFVLAGRRVAVIGATLWTDYRLYGTDARDAMREADHGLNDHRSIRFTGRRFLPADARALNARAYRWLADALLQARRDADFVIAVTHHAVKRRPKGRRLHFIRPNFAGYASPDKFRRIYGISQLAVRFRKK